MTSSSESPAQHICEYNDYDEPAYGLVSRCECGKLNPSRYGHAERGYPEGEEIPMWHDSEDRAREKAPDYWIVSSDTDQDA